MKEESVKPTVTVALCGNPNSGKTTLFNALTGSNQKVGNWPGVTVEKKTGLYKNDKTIAIADIPGVYSLTPFTLDEQVAQRYLLTENPDVIINVIDGTNLERNMFLTTQLLELDVPVVLALNMHDEAVARGIKINCEKLHDKLGADCFFISAAKEEGITELMQFCAEGKFSPKKPIKFTPDVESAAEEIQKLCPNLKNSRYSALKLLEKDAETAAQNNVDREKVAEIADRLSKRREDPLSAVLAKQRYKFIEKTVSACQNTQKSDHTEKAAKITEKIDKIVLNKWLAFPIFACVMALIFYVSIGGLGGWLCDLINEQFTPWLQGLFTKWLEPANAPWLTSLVVDGILAGVFGVISFVPQIMLLFGFIAALEGSGYMSRIAFITDRLLSKIGLGGKSFVSMILGCGCSVPAIMATRTIKNVNERNNTITLTSFMPCSAKMAVISFFTAKLLGGNALFAVSFYFLSILAVIFGGLIMKVFRRKKTGAADTFIMELPNYRAPSIVSVLRQMYDRGKAFLVKAGTVIFVASVVLWVLQSYDWHFAAVEASGSMLASIGKVIAPIFTPLGFGDWRFAVATLSGLAAKETVVTTVEILVGSDVAAAITPLGAYSFVVYNLLTVPCVAAVSASFSEQGSAKRGFISIAYQLALSYIVSLAIYQFGLLAQKYTEAFIITVACIIIAFGIYFAVRYLVRKRGCNYECDHCPKNGTCTKK